MSGLVHLSTSPSVGRTPLCEERWAVLMEAAFSLLSGAAHDDAGVTDRFEWDRSEAITLNATVAGLLGQMASHPTRHL